MNGHAARVAKPPPSGVAPDVASRATFPGNANPDRRHFTLLEVPELLWPLVFGFVRVIDDDGTERWACTGVDIGRPILRDEDDGLDTDHFELTAERFRHISDNFDRYRLMAELRLIATDENLERSRRVRAAMKRKKGDPWSRESRALLVNDWRVLEGQPGRMYELERRWKIARSNIHRALDQAEDEGLIEPGERQHRSN
jgi:hypothetical protein